MAAYTSAGYLELGSLIGDVFRLFRTHLGRFVLVASGILVPLGLLNVALGQIQQPQPVADALSELSATGLQWQSVATILSSFWAWGLAGGLLVTALVQPLLDGVLVRMTSQVIRGEPHHLLDPVRYAARRWLRLVLARLLLAGAAILALVAPSGFVMLLLGSSTSDGPSPMAGPLLVLMVLVTIGIVVLLIPIAVRLQLVTQVIIVEDQGVAASIRRSWEVTRGEFWRLIGYAIVLAIVLVIISMPIGMIVGLLGLVLPWIDALNFDGWITTPLDAIATTLIFYGLRTQEERFKSTDAPVLPASANA